jgi:hypothetical protein
MEKQIQDELKKQGLQSEKDLRAKEISSLKNVDSE